MQLSVSSLTRPDNTNRAQQGHRMQRYLYSLLAMILLWGMLIPPKVASAQLPPAALSSLAPLLPELLGMNGPATYLIIVQNNDELRPTGGFISAVGTLTMEQGGIAALDFVDSYDFYRAELAYPPAPLPMQRYMNIPILLLRDANWSPDLPTTAKLLRSLYRQHTGQEIDGIITVDLRAVELIISALEPLEIPETGEAITGATVIQQIKEMYSIPPSIEANIAEADLGAWWRRRKEFIPTLASVIRQRIESGNVEVFKLLAAGQTALSERAVQVWLADPAARAEIAKLGWDGGLQPLDDADYLALVDMNMGYNKVDAVVNRELDYKVTWPSGEAEPAVATATITYTHSLDVADEVCAPTPRYGSDYDDMTERCYFNYVRLYVPAGSTLIRMTGVNSSSISSQRGEMKTQVFSGYFMLRPGEHHVVRIQYTLPPTISAENYQLRVQRQSGTRALPLTIAVAEETTSTTLSQGRWEWSLAQ